MEHYPCVRYAYGEQPRLCRTPEEEAALGPGWFDSPAKVQAPAPVEPEPLAGPFPLDEQVAEPVDPATEPADQAPAKPARPARRTH